MNSIFGNVAGPFIEVTLKYREYPSIFPLEKVLKKEESVLSRMYERRKIKTGHEFICTYSMPKYWKPNKSTGRNRLYLCTFLLIEF